MKGRKPNIDEVAGGAWAGAKRFAQRQAAAAGETLGHTTDIQVQDARAVLAQEFFRYLKNNGAGGHKAPITYATLMSYLWQRYNYVPDDIAQAAIMRFMKGAGSERLGSSPEEYPDILQKATKDPMSVEVANAARAVVANPRDRKVVANLRRLADRLGKNIGVDGRHVAQAYAWKVEQLNGEQGQRQQSRNAQQNPGGANAQAQHPNNQGNHPMQESFEVLASRLLERHDEFEFAAASLLLEDLGQGENLYGRAVEVARKYQDNFTTAKLQRDLGIPYKEAAGLVQQLEKNKVVSALDPRTRMRTVLQPKGEPNEWDAHPDGQEDHEGEHETQTEPQAEPDQDVENQAQQAAEAPGPTGEPAQAARPEQNQTMNQRDASANRWKNSIEQNLPNKDARLNRSQFDKLLAIVASDLVRRQMFSYGKNRNHNGELPPDSQTKNGGGGGGDTVLTSSGSRFDIKKFEKTLADASVKPEEIADILRKAKNSEDVRGAEEAIMRSGESRQAAAAIAAAFGRAFKPSGAWGH